MTDLKQFITEYAKENDWGTDKEELFEIFEDGFDIVWQGEPDHHRWYTNYDAVWKVPINGVDRFFMYYIMSADGDGCRDDCGYEIPDLDDIVEVFPKTVPTTIYVTKDKL